MTRMAMTRMAMTGWLAAASALLLLGGCADLDRRHGRQSEMHRGMDGAGKKGDGTGMMDKCRRMMEARAAHDHALKPDAGKADHDHAKHGQAGDDKRDDRAGCPMRS